MWDSTNVSKPEVNVIHIMDLDLSKVFNEYMYAWISGWTGAARDSWDRIMNVPEQLSFGNYSSTLTCELVITFTNFPHLPQPNPHDSRLPNTRQIILGLHGIGAVTILLFRHHTLLFETSEEQEAALHSKSRHPEHQPPDQARAAHVHITKNSARQPKTLARVRS